MKVLGENNNILTWDLVVTSFGFLKNTKITRAGDSRFSLEHIKIPFIKFLSSSYLITINDWTCFPASVLQQQTIKSQNHMPRYLIWLDWRIGAQRSPGGLHTWWSTALTAHDPTEHTPDLLLTYCKYTVNILGMYRERFYTLFSITFQLSESFQGPNEGVESLTPLHASNHIEYNLKPRPLS